MRLDFSAKSDYFFGEIEVMPQSDQLLIGQRTNRLSVIRLYEASLDDSLFDPFNTPSDSKEYLNLQDT